MFWEVLTTHTSTVSRTWNLCLIAFTIVLETPRSLAVTTCEDGHILSRILYIYSDY